MSSLSPWAIIPSKWINCISLEMFLPFSHQHHLFTKIKTSLNFSFIWKKMYPTKALKYILKSVMTTQFLPHGTRKGSHTILATLKCYKAFLSFTTHSYPLQDLNLIQKMTIFLHVFFWVYLFFFFLAFVLSVYFYLRYTLNIFCCI